MIIFDVVGDRRAKCLALALLRLAGAAVSILATLSKVITECQDLPVAAVARAGAASSKVLRDFDGLV